MDMMTGAEDIPDLSRGHIVENPKAAAKHGFVIRRLDELVGDSNTRGKIPIRRFKRSCSLRGQSEFGQILEIEAGTAGRDGPSSDDGAKSRSHRAP